MSTCNNCKKSFDRKIDWLFGGCCSARCSNEFVVAYRLEVSEKKREQNREYKMRSEVVERRREQGKEYRARPEIKEYMRKYHKKDYVKEKKRAYHQRPDVQKRLRSYQREYNKRSYVMEKRRQWEREYIHKPEIAAKRKAYRYEYNRREGVKEDRRLYARERYRLLSEEKKERHRVNSNARSQKITVALEICRREGWLPETSTDDEYKIHRAAAEKILKEKGVLL